MFALTAATPSAKGLSVIHGLVMGQSAVERATRRSFRVVAIDPDLNTVEAEDAVGGIVVDTIDHFVASYACA